MCKTLKYMFLLIATLLGFSSCSNDKILDEGVIGRGNSVTFTLQGALRATATPDHNNPIIVQTPALDREKSVSEIYAVLFNNGTFFKTVKATGSGTYNVAIDQTGTFDMFLVANPDAALVAKLQNNITSIASYEQLVVTQSPGEDKTATNFLMTSERKTVTTSSATPTAIGAIKLTRLAARFDLYNRVPELKITKITMKNRFVESRIARGALNERMDGLTSNSTKTYEAAQGLTSYDCIAAMYSYENAFAGGTSLVIEGQYDGKELYPYEILLEKLPIKRNHLYTIIINSKTNAGDSEDFEPGNDSFGSFDFEIKVNDWEAGETIEWAGANAASAVVPNFTATATANLTEAGNDNPTTLTVTNSAANTVTLTVKGVAAGSNLVHVEGALPQGYTVTPNPVTLVAGVPTQTFTIALPQNRTYTKELPFELQNALDPTVKRDVVLKHEGVRVKLPIEYMADYNVAADGMSFATSHDNNVSNGLFNFSSAIAKFTSIKIDGKNYHLPSRSELMAVTAHFTPNVLLWNQVINKADVTEEARVKGETATYTADYRTTVNKIAYAVKFKGNGDTYKCAYRYEYMGTSAPGSTDSRLKITVRYLGTTNPTVTIANVATEAFWTTNNADDIVKFIPASGSQETEEPSPTYGTSGYIRTSDATRENQSYVMSFSASGSNTFPNAGHSTKLGVRLFSDK